MRKIDKTKKNIKINTISDATRQELFDKFVEAGGEIIDDEVEIIVKAGKKGIFDRKKQAAYKKILDTHKKNASKNKSSKKKSGISVNKQQDKNIAYPEYKPGLFISLSQRLIIRLRLFLMGITDFSGDIFNNKFVHLLNTEYKTSLIGIKLLYLELFKQNKNIEHNLIYELDKIKHDNSILIENTAHLYDEDAFDNIISEYKLSATAILPIITYKNDITSIFGKLYILKPYEHIILSAFNSAIGIHMKLTDRKPSSYNKKLKNIRDDLYIIFEKLFYSLYWLLCRYHNRIIPIGSFEFEKLLNINSFKLQNKKHTPPPVEEMDTRHKEEDEESDDKNQNKELSDEIKAGLMLMKNFTYRNIRRLRAEYDYTKTFTKLNDKDKLLLTYIILQEFDNEYSFLLTTSKIKYKFGNSISDKTEFKDKLLHYYDDIKKCMDSIKEYSEEYEIFNKIKSEKPYSSDRYIAHSKDLNAAAKKRDQAADTARYLILSLMNNILSAFHILINDINGAKMVVSDPDDKIVFDISIDGEKFLNNKTIHEALTIACNFASAFAFRLTTDGDLSGSLEFDEMDKQNDNKEANKITDSKKQQVEQSIIDEIDDLFTK